jgi:DNA-binding transcriptional LysR family regulator
MFEVDLAISRLGREPAECLTPDVTCVKCNLFTIILLTKQQGVHVFDEIRTFVVLAEAGSLQRAAERLFLTPSAVTRQIQRLETALKTPLLDRRVKPALITREGRVVLDGGRHVLRIMDDLKATGSKDAQPSGIFRIGLSHALAQPSLVASIHRLTTRFRQLQPVLSTDQTPALIDQARTGALDVALAFRSADGMPPDDVASTVLTTERLVVVKARGSRSRARRSGRSTNRELDARWVLNPPGCLIRGGLQARLRELGAPFEVAAEINNIEMQLSLVASGIGIGIFPERFIASHPRRERLERIANSGIRLEITIVFMQTGHLGRLKPAASVLEEELRKHFAHRGHASR